MDEMNGYNGAYTGAQIDTAIGAVRNKETTWDGKQDKLTGLQGQYVGFDSDGDAIAQNAPDPGVMTFNGRTGAVMPQSGDYTADMVGARASNWTPTAADVGAVPTDRTVNGQALSQNITLNAENVGARPATWLPTPQEINAVPTSRTVNGHELSANITLSADDVGARADSWMPSATDVGAASAADVEAVKPFKVAITIPTSGWSDNQQTFTVTGIPSDPQNHEVKLATVGATNTQALMDAGLYILDEATNSLTLKVSTVPTASFQVYAVITPLQ